ncbi:cobalamin-binding protein [Alkalicoccus urumqiensis]|uniref:Cobalamin-binding protein n=1 Tax=Alkalicoccus urumqiensis TaxID=1548213 RepID=A0A2P6MKZ2_ALKUR|nr:cobalamin-binding protein [Alkalicoccus urumqiensis]PRO66934.1 cobalamin-binding protein [Alkalicoccus urumqiensis]
MRIVSLCPSNTELLYYAGLGKQLVGVDNYSDWPVEVKRLPQLGPDLSIDMDKTASLKPDMIYASLSVPGMEKNIEELEKRRLPYTIVRNPETLSEVGTALKEICEGIGNPDRGELLEKAYLEHLEQYRQQSSGIQHRPAVYWEWWPKPVFTPGARNWLTELTELAGGVNVFAGEDTASVQTTWEEAAGRMPDTALFAWVGVDPEKVTKKAIMQRPRAELLETMNWHIVEEALFCRPSPRLLAGLAKAAHLLHPDRFPVPDGDEDAFLFRI